MGDARAGVAHSPWSGEPVESRTPEAVVQELLRDYGGARVQIAAPLVRDRKGEHRALLDDLRRKGFVRVRVDGAVQRILYPNAHHAWDSPREAHFSDFDSSYGGCDVEINEAGAVSDNRTGTAIDTAESGRRFIEGYATPGVWMGRDLSAREQSLLDLVERLAGQ